VLLRGDGVLKSKKPDPFKGRRKIIPIRPPGKELSFEEIVEKFDEYMHDPEQLNKIFSELGFSYVDDECEGDCPHCEKKNSCTVYANTKDSPKSKKSKKNIIPLKPQVIR
jgi:hypothetical protein